MIIGKNAIDGAYLIQTDRRVACSGCGKFIEQGDFAWSYLASPYSGNYVEHDKCRYGDDDDETMTAVGDGGNP